MKISKEAWHFQIAKFGAEDIERYRDLDFCTYTRLVMKGALLATFLCALITLAAWGALSFGMWLVISLRIFWFGPPLPAFLFLVVLGAFSLVAIIAGTFQLFGKAAATGPVRKAYRSWKDKYCPIVELDSPH